MPKTIMNKIGRPNPSDAPTWYAYFLNLVPGDDLIKALQDNKQHVLDVISSVPAEKADFKYGEDKWTVKQVFIHLNDDERYYNYKAFCYSRQVDCFLEVPQGDDYNKDFNAPNRTLEDIAAEFITIRDALISLISNMSNAMLDFKNFPAKEPYTARALGWFAVGHSEHHLKLLRERYGV